MNNSEELVLDNMEYDRCFPAKYMAEKTGLPEKEVRSVYQTLKKDGYAYFSVACDEYEGTPCGSGYFLTKEGERARQALWQRARLEREIDRLKKACEAAWELSTWAACINWHARDSDNTGEWLDDLRFKINDAQALLEPIVSASSPKGDE